MRGYMLVAKIHYKKESNWDEVCVNILHNFQQEAKLFGEKGERLTK
jgi:hypothetical protein